LSRKAAIVAIASAALTPVPVVPTCAPFVSAATIFNLSAP
jgi:hypothetical protein